MRPAPIPNVQIFHAGTKRDGTRILADGGRVLGVTARGANIAEAQARAYAAVDKIDWPGGFCRRDIGWRAVRRRAKLRRRAPPKNSRNLAKIVL